MRIRKMFIKKQNKMLKQKHVSTLFDQNDARASAASICEGDYLKYSPWTFTFQ